MQRRLSSRGIFCPVLLVAILFTVFRRHAEQHQPSISTTKVQVPHNLNTTEPVQHDLPTLDVLSNPKHLDKRGDLL